MSVVPDILSFAGNLIEGGILGGLARLGVQVLKLFTDKADRDHEFRMAKLASEGRLSEIGAQHAQAVDTGWLTALTEAVRGQSAVSTDTWAGRLSAGVRPIVTLWLLALYTASKAAVLWGLVTANVELSAAVAAAWTPTDAGVMGSVLAFWFLDRALQQGQAIQGR